MISIKVDKNSVSSEINGGFMTVCSEAIVIMKHIYEAIKEDNEEAAEAFAHCITRAFSDGIVFDDDKLKEMAEKIREKKAKNDKKSDLKKVSGDLLDKVQEILDMMEDAMK